MAFWSKFLRLRQSPEAAEPVRRQASFQPSGGGRLITTSAELEEALRTGDLTASGQAVTPETAMRVATVYGCVRLLTGTVANLPLQVKRRVDDRRRDDATDDPLWRLLTRRPNRWQTPSQFKRQMQSSVCLRGAAYALKVVSRGRVIELVPLAFDRVVKTQLDDLSIVYDWTSRQGRKMRFGQDEIFDLMVWTLDGVHGVSPIAYARETIGLATAMRRHGAETFANGATVSGVLTHPGVLGQEGIDNLHHSLDEYRGGGERAGGDLVLEEGMKYERMALTAEDAQWIESQQFTRTDLAMFFGVPPFMLGDTEKSTSWGTGIEQQGIGYRMYSAEDHLVAWEETVDRDLIPEDSTIYARFNRSAMVRADMKTRYEAYQIGRQNKWLSANDVRELEDENPIEGGDIYENPNTSTNREGSGA